MEADLVNFLGDRSEIQSGQTISLACSERRPISRFPTANMDNVDRCDHFIGIDPFADQNSLIRKSLGRVSCRFEDCDCEDFVAASSGIPAECDNCDSDDHQNRFCQARRSCGSCNHAFAWHILSPQGESSSDANDQTILDWSAIVKLVSLILYDTQAVPIRLKILLDHCFAEFRRQNSQIDHHSNCDETNLLDAFGWTLDDYFRGYIIKDSTGNLLEHWSMCSLPEEEAVLDEFSNYKETRTLALNLMVHDDGCRRDQDDASNSGGSPFMEAKNDSRAFSRNMSTSLTPALLEGLALRSWSRAAAAFACQPLGLGDQRVGSDNLDSPIDSQISPSSLSTSSSSFSSFQKKAHDDDFSAGNASETLELAATSTNSQLPPMQDEAEDLSMSISRSPSLVPPKLGFRGIKSDRELNSRKIGHLVSKNCSQNNQPSGRVRSNHLGTNPATGKRRVQCYECLGTFCDKGALKIHMSAVHWKHMHKCLRDDCNALFSSRRSRNRHSANPNPKLHSMASSLNFSRGVGIRSRGGLKPHNVLSLAAASLGFRVVSPPAAAEQYEKMMAEVRKKEEASNGKGGDAVLDDLDSTWIGRSTVSNGSHRPKVGDPEMKTGDRSKAKEGRLVMKEILEDANRKCRSDEISSSTKIAGVRKRKSDRPVRLHSSAFDEIESNEKRRIVDERDTDGVVNGQADSCLDDGESKPLDFSRPTAVPISETYPATSADPLINVTMSPFLSIPSAWHQAALALSSTNSIGEILANQGINGSASKKFGRAVAEEHAPSFPLEDAKSKSMVSTASPDPSTDKKSNLSVEKKASPSLQGQRFSVPVNEANHRQCLVCHKVFQNQFSVKTHYQNVHLKLPHKCTVSGCNATFPSKRSRDRHSANKNLHRKLLSTSSREPTPVLHTTTLPMRQPTGSMAPPTLPGFGSSQHPSLFGSPTTGLFVSPSSLASFGYPATILGQLFASLASCGKLPPGVPNSIPDYPLSLFPPVPDPAQQQTVNSEFNFQCGDKLSKKANQRVNQSPPSRQFSSVPFLPGFSNGETTTTA